ncbi:MAG: MFS transporter [Promethearchaeota archaeon]
MVAPAADAGDPARELLEEHVPLKSKVALGIGGVGNALMSGITYAAITFFYNAKLGLDGKLLGVGWLVFMVWNALNDPIFGNWMDNSKHKLGRRVPFIRYGAPIYGLTFIFCWYPVVPLDDQWALFFNFLLALVLLDTMYSIVGTCYFALPNEMAVTAKERASIGVVTSAFGVISIVVTFLVPLRLLTGDEVGLNPWFRPVMVLIAVVSTVLLYITSYFLKENRFAVMQEKESLWAGLKATLKNKAFFIYEIFGFSMTLLMTIIQTGLFYYFDYIVADQVFLPSGDVNLGVGLVFVLSLAGGVGTGVVVNLRKIPPTEWGPKRVIIVNMVAVTSGFLLLFVLGRNLVAASGAFFILTFGAGGGLVSLPALTGDVIDNDELITGRRREGFYGGVNAIITKPAISLANWAFLGIIGAFGFVRPVLEGGVVVKQPQTDLALTGILFALSIVPAIFTTISAIGMRWYPLDGPEWVEKKRQIMELHARKEREFLEWLEGQEQIEGGGAPNFLGSCARKG